MLIPSGAAYVDYVEEDELTGVSSPLIINAYPHAAQTGVPAADAGGSHQLQLTVVDIGGNGLSASDTHVFVTTIDGGVVEVFDGTSFHADWAQSSRVIAQSPGSGVDDEHRFTLVRSTAFVSLDAVSVHVTAATTIAETLDTTYSFQIEDLTAPELTAVETRGLTKLLLTFDEDMTQGSGVLGDALLVRDISGGIEVNAANGLDPATISSSKDAFTADDVGMFIGIAGADNALNNDIFLITGYVSNREVEISGSDVITEALSADTITTVSPYRVAGVPDAKRISPFFNPIIIAAAQGGGGLATVELTLHTEITQQRDYTFYAKLVTDVSDNFIADTTLEFTTEPCEAPVDRAFSVPSMLPDENFRRDTTRDLARFSAIYDEVLQLILCDVDKFTNILDIDLIGEENLDALLAHLGAPFSFAASLSATDKRRLASILVELYKRKGGEVAIEATVAFILGVDIDVQPYLNPAGTWQLGISELGENTVVGPGTSFLRYAFQVESFEDLTALQRQRMIEIVNYMKPAHTHFVRLIEPTTAPTIVFTGWQLGEDLLGDTTILG